LAKENELNWRHREQRKAVESEKGNGREQERKSEDRGRELLSVMDDHPCERAINYENGATKTVTEDF